MGHSDVLSDSVESCQILRLEGAGNASGVRGAGPPRSSQASKAAYKRAEGGSQWASNRDSPWKYMPDASSVLPSCTAESREFRLILRCTGNAIATGPGVTAGGCFIRHAAALKSREGRSPAST